MSERSPKNLPASIRQKLSDLARARKDDFGLILVKYGLERILYRLSRSAHHDAFVLKGALLFELWTHDTYRPTRDADFLGRGDNAPNGSLPCSANSANWKSNPTASPSTQTPSGPNESPKTPTMMACPRRRPRSGPSNSSRSVTSLVRGRSDHGTSTTRTGATRGRLSRRSTTAFHCWEDYYSRR